MQTKLRTYEITPNDNICFPIGTILAVENLYEELNLSSILGKHKNQIANGHPTLKGRVCKGRPPISGEVRNRLVSIVQISFFYSI